MRRRRRLAAAGIGLLAVLTIPAAHAASGAKPTHAAATGSPTVYTMSLPVDRQDYVTDTPDNPASGEPIDPYNSDATSIHVAVNGGHELARSFVHMPLDYLPSGAQAVALTVQFSVTQQSDASNTGTYPVYNTNTSSAIIEACALTTELAINFDENHPPGYDCEHGSAVGVPNSSHSAWTFNMRDLLAYWAQHGDTGAALIPISPSPGSSFSVAFYANRSQATVGYVTASPVVAPPTGASPLPHTSPAGRPVAAPTQTAAPTATPAQSTQSSAKPAPASSTATPAATNSANGASSAGRPQAASPSPAPSQSATRGATHGSPTWPWVLALCLVVAACALGYAHRGQLAVLWRQAFPPLARSFKAHPRAHTLAAIAAAWGLIFTGYSISNQHSGPALPIVAAGGQLQGGGLEGQASSATGQLIGSPTGGSSTAGTSAVNTAAQSTQSASSSTGIAQSTTPTTNPATTEFNGPGTWRTIDGTQVFFPANGGPPVADLYHGADDTIGLTPNGIKLCAHAALTYGSAFDIKASDLNVYWQWLNAHGGVYGRQVTATYQNDNYDPGTAVQAAQACKDWGTFVLMSGIGFDQVPAVRQWAEQNHELYMYTTATSQDTQGLRYSFTYQPSVEQMGTVMGQLAVRQFRGKKIGIIYRNSSNWTPGVTTFEQMVRSAGMHVVGSYPVTINQGDYTDEIVQLETAGAQVVFVWENALADIEIIKQMQGQNYHPPLLMAAFNIITNSLGSTSLEQQMWSAQPWDAYDPGYYGGGFASYAGDIHEFEAMYKQYDPGANLSGDGGDILFQTWEAWKEVGAVLQKCGLDCTRNKVAGMMLAGFDATVSPNCNVDFNLTSDHHHGGYLFQELHVIDDPNGHPNFVPVARCVSQI